MAESFKSIERDGWESRASVYRDATALATTQAIPELLRAVRSRLGMRLLDICTGPGYAAGAAEAIGCEVTGIDFAPAMVDLARETFPRCRFEVGDGEALDLRDAAFDAAVCNYGVFHFGEPEEAFAEAARVLVPGGRYAWSQWVGPDGCALMGTIMKSVKQHADMEVGLPPAPPPFRFSDPATAESAMREAGFEDIVIDRVPSVMHIPAGDFGAFFRRFSVRMGMLVERQEPAIAGRITDEISEGFEAFRSGNEWVVPAPGIVVSGRKPH